MLARIKEIMVKRKHPINELPRNNNRSSFIFHFTVCVSCVFFGRRVREGGEGELLCVSAGKIIFDVVDVSSVFGSDAFYLPVSSL